MEVGEATITKTGVMLAEKNSERVREIRTMIARGERLMSYYRCAMMEIETKFRVLSEQFAAQHVHNPIDTIKTRLKSYESILEKLERLNVPISVDSIEENLHDVAGVRVICAFQDDIYWLADCLTSQDDIRLIQKKDYIQTPKDNGYRSLHLIVEIPIFLCDEKKYVKVEVQLRTIAMESWANLEHRIYYKKNIPENLQEEITMKLKFCAEMSEQLDLEMQQIRNAVEE